MPHFLGLQPERGPVDMNYQVNNLFEAFLDGQDLNRS